MELGTYAADVLDIVDLVESGAVFRDPRPPLGPGLKVIHEMADAKNYLHVIADYPEDEGWDWREVLDRGGDLSGELLDIGHDRRKSAIGLTESLDELMEGR